MKGNNSSIFIFVMGVSMLVGIFIPQLFFGRAYSNGDALFAFYPALSFFSTQLAKHSSYLWSHSVLSGFPTHLDLLGGFYSPVTIFLFKHLSVITAYNLEIFFSTGFLLFFSYLWARQVNLSREASLLTAIVYSFGFQMAPWSNNITVVNAMFVLPMLLVSLAKIKERKYWWVLIGGLLTGYALIAGQPQWVLLGFVGAGLYALFDMWPDIKKIGLSKQAGLLIGGILAMAIIGFGVSAFQILPAQKLTALSGRSGGLSFSAAQITSQTPFDWLWYLLPDFAFKYLNAPEPTLYVGILPLLLAVFAFLKIRKKDPRAQFAISLFVFGILAALRFSPVFWLMHKLPVFEYFRGSDRWMYIGNLGVAMLAGLGLDALKLDISSGLIASLRKFIGWISAIIISGVTVLNVLFLLFYRRVEAFLYAYYDTHYYENSTHLPVQHYHNSIKSLVDDTFWNVSFLNIRFVFALLFLLIGYLFLKSLRGAKNLSHRQSIGIVVLAFLNLAILHYNYYQIMPRSLVEAQPELVSVITAQQNGANPSRYFTVLPGPAVNEILRSPHVGVVTKDDQVEFERGMLVVSGGMQYGIDTIDGYNNLMPHRVAEVLAMVGSERATISGLADKKENVQGKLQEISSRLPLLSMLNVKYIVSGYQLPATPHLSLIHTASLTRFNIPMYLYENSAVLPRFYLANTIIPIPSDDTAAFAAITNPADDFSKATYLECSDCQANTVSKKDSLAITTYTDGLLDTNVTIESGRWLVFSESNLPGWQITIDNHPVKATTANYLFQAVYVPKGEHEVKWVYEGI